MDHYWNIYSFLQLLALTFHIHTHIKIPRNIIAKDTTFLSLLHQHNYRFIDDDIPRILHELLNGSQMKQFSGRTLSTLVGDHYSMYHFWRKTLRHFSITSSKLEKQFRQIDSEALRRSLAPVHHHERGKEHYIHNSVLILYRNYEWSCTHSGILFTLSRVLLHWN